MKRRMNYSVFVVMLIVGILIPVISNNIVINASADEEEPSEKAIVYSDLTAGDPLQADIRWNEWEGTVAVSNYTDDPYEGSNSMCITPTGSLWWGMGVEAIPRESLYLWTGGEFVFSIKTIYSGAFVVGFQSGIHPTTHVDAFIPIVPGRYGYENDGNWHQVQIPIDDIVEEAPMVDIGDLANVFVIMDDGAVDNQPIYVDDIYYVKSPDFEPETEKPTKPKGLQATYIYDTRVHFTWEPSSDNIGIAGYNIYQDGVEIGSTTKVKNSYTALNLTAGTTYSFNVRAYDIPRNLSPMSSTLKVTTMIYEGTKNLTLVWSEEFNYTGLPDSSIWNYEDWEPGKVNDELQKYTKERLENTRVEDDHLIIEARRDFYNGYEYTSGRLTSQNKGDWKYGRIEAKIMLPVGIGTWPAFWMMPTDSKYGGWPDSGEIDILEHVGYDPGEVHGTVHTEAYNWPAGTQVGNSTTVEDCQYNYHVYALEWTEDKMEWYVDDNLYFSFYKEGSSDVWPFDQEFYVILNIAIGGNWGGVEGVNNSIFPTSMLVDYVRVYSIESPIGHIPGSSTSIPGYRIELLLISIFFGLVLLKKKFNT